MWHCPAPTGRAGAGTGERGLPAQVPSVHGAAVEVGVTLRLGEKEPTRFQSGRS